ncbi:hypothetical protein Fot_05700 [Forsythia ovata]|uniref:Uncharacterized protein n=1 Tax=Forsythia ovata TaxID=205694 RepID=A0ABD1WR60_9LAMI
MPLLGMTIFPHHQQPSSLCLIVEYFSTKVGVLQEGEHREGPLLLSTPTGQWRKHSLFASGICRTAASGTYAVRETLSETPKSKGPAYVVKVYRPKNLAISRGLIDTEIHVEDEHIDRSLAHRTKANTLITDPHTYSERVSISEPHTISKSYLINKPRIIRSDISSASSNA